ncbi:hypothetical protein CY0110_18192 [Crocosphaera chwakensis CCY0110]|uniref:Uncharacterized protein n=1 Tax=Crocosphaera chwakensis CCY0110 TaxID=391612 RepID=A3IIX0_9CHRO|nr:hypothetical protein CY0110_18192 [Crocosphaera chwakensis CCY0110]
MILDSLFNLFKISQLIFYFKKLIL